MFKGCAVALVTPFRNERVDFDALGRLMDIHIAAGTDSILVCGTTGESATMTHQEHKDVISFAVNYLEEKSDGGRKKMPILIAGAGSNCTRESVELTQHAKNSGATLSLSITPYYNRPTQAGLIAHFTTIANEVGLPMILYNVPSRTGVNMEVDTVVKLSEHPKIIAVKEASGNSTQISEIIRRTPDDFLVFCGDDALTLAVISMGGDGVISVIANLTPKDTKDMVHAALEGNMHLARKLHHKQVPLVQALFKETNPIPIKTALKQVAGQKSVEGGPVWPDVGDLRLPLLPMSDGGLEVLRQSMRDYGFCV